MTDEEHEKAIVELLETATAAQLRGAYCAVIGAMFDLERGPGVAGRVKIITNRLDKAIAARMRRGRLPD